MRIAIDARLNAYRQGGIPQYTRQLMTALAEVAPEEQIISLQHRDHLRPLVVAPNVARRTVLTPPHHRLEPWTLPAEVLLARPDVLHCPDFIAPPRRPFPAVVTIHDLAFLHYPQILDDAARAYYGRVRSSAIRADAIVAVSEATRQDIAQLLDIPADQVDVIYEAAAPLYGRIELRPGEVRVLDGTPVTAGSFMLFVSTLEPRKNLPTLLRALRILLDRTPAAGYHLVVAGSRGWRDEEIFAAVRDLRLEDHVTFARRVGQYDLRWLYNACRLYLNPSLYEGFGLPLLEAMACGAPCLAAATSSLPEIGGEAALYVPPLEPDQWADTIQELWDDEERRAELGRRGRVQAQRFSWLRAARETLAVYRRVL
ncbi:MAG TPA: glycosyltransferase family 1 protein, partial [Roseiflexaceae bacterium]|nr:glycosyltransferase family 1 protein [Roseiflexaceae bacterium]